VFAQEPGLAYDETVLAATLLDAGRGGAVVIRDTCARL
jgi:hypothetical protein